MSVRRDIHAGFLGFYLDFARRWWRKPGRNEAIGRAHGVMERLAQTGIRVVDFFTFVSDWRQENRYISGMEPWKRKRIGSSSRPFDFDEPRYKFYKCYKKFCELLFEHRLRPCATRFLRHAYMQTLFGNNVQQIRTMSDPKFLSYAIDYNDRLMEIEAEVFGEEYRQWGKISNEWSHHEREFGQTVCDRGHFIADFHADMWDFSMKAGGVLGRHIMDISHSEYVKAYFSQPSVCPKCGIKVFDRPDLRGDNNGANNVVVIPELHGYSIPENLDADFEDFLNHTPHNPEIRLHEDGGGGPLAKGYAIGHFKIGDNQQSYEFGKKCWTGAKNAGKRVIYGVFPLETLRRESDGEYREDYHVDVINWERIDNIVRAYNEVYGG